jgi:hypothetical protein
MTLSDGENLDSNPPSLFVVRKKKEKKKKKRGNHCKLIPQFTRTSYH